MPYVAQPTHSSTSWFLVRLASICSDDQSLSCGSSKPSSTLSSWCSTGSSARRNRSYACAYQQISPQALKEPACENRGCSLLSHPHVSVRYAPTGNQWSICRDVPGVAFATCSNESRH